MQTSFDTSHLIAIAAALGFTSGLRLYAALFLVGLAGRTLDFVAGEAGPA